MVDDSREAVTAIYVEPVFELAKDAGETDSVQQELALLAKVFREEKEYANLLSSPFLRLKDREGLINNVFGDKLSDLSMGLLFALLKRNRVGLIPEISEKFEWLLLEDSGVVIIELTLSKEPDEENLDGLTRKFESACGSPVRLIIKVDPSIIGGVIIRQGDTVVDNSVSTALANASKQIVSGVAS